MIWRACDEGVRRGLIAVNSEEEIVIDYHDWIVIIVSCWSRSLAVGTR